MKKLSYRNLAYSYLSPTQSLPTELPGLLGIELNQASRGRHVGFRYLTLI